MLQLLTMLWIWGLCIMCKLRRLGVWVICSVASTPKNSGLRLCFAPLVQTNKMHLCVSEESCLMLCILFSCLCVSPRNLKTLPFFLGCFLSGLFVVLQWCLVRLVIWSLHCERRTVCCPLLLGLYWFFTWWLLGIHLGGAGHGHICHIYLVRWHMVSVVVSGVIHACTFVVLF